MDNNDFLDHGTDQSGLTITNEIKDFLHQTAGWAKILGIIGFVFAGIVAIMALFSGTIMSSMIGELDGMNAMGGIGAGIITLVYLGMAAIQFFPAYYCYKFGTRMKSAVEDGDQEYMREGFKNLKSLFKFYGIAVFVFLGFYLLMFVLAGVFGLAAM